MQGSGVQISQPCSLANPFCNLTEKILYFTEFLKIFSNFLLRTQTEKIPCSFYFTLSLFPHVFLNWFIKLKYPYYEVKQSKNTLKTVNSLLCPSLLTPLGYAPPYYSPSSNAQSAMWLWQENVHYFTVIFFSEKWKLLVMSNLYSPMDSTVHRILQARILEWVAFPLYRRSSQLRDQIQVSCIAVVFFTSWATREAQEYWSG